MGDLTLGQYFPGESVIHRMDPRMKLILSLFFLVLIFQADSGISYLLTVCFLVAVMRLSCVPLRMYLKCLKPVWFVVVFIALINLFSYPENPIVSFWIVKISLAGILSAVRMALRIVLLMLSTSILTYTTSPVLIAGGLEGLLSPLAKIGVPVRDFSMMLTTALRFIPTLADETGKIINAQKARGADFETGGLIKRARAVVPVIIPLFVSCFRHADELAEAMQCRCCGKTQNKRTRYIVYRLRGLDFAAFGITAAVLVGVILLRNIRIAGLV